MDGGDVRERTLKLIDFLEAYDARRNPPVYDIAKYGLYALRDSDVPVSEHVRVTHGGDSWLTVDFVELPPRPELDKEVERFLRPAEDLSPLIAPVVGLEDDASDEEIDAAARAEEWIADAWRPWSEEYQRTLKVKSLYRDIFEQRERLAVDRDSVELVWGFGRLRWHAQEGVHVDHPLLVTPVEVERDDATQALRVRPAGALDIEATCLAGLPLDDRAGYMAIRQSFVEADAVTDPWDLGSMTDLFRRLVRCIDHDGALVGEADLPDRHAGLDTSWVLFLRRRRPDYQGFLDGMRDLYKSGIEIPNPVQAFVIDAPSTLGASVENGEDSATSSTDQRLLLPLPTNEEQQRIVSFAQTRSGVTVQGPPGTGKSHTIANVISHYVAYGKRVLVVAEKEQALRVLGEKVPSDIRDLTVSVLGADEQGRRQLESAITQVQTRVAGLDREFADTQIQQLTSDLDGIDRDIAATISRLLAARAAEVGHLPGEWHAGTDLTPSEAAEWVGAHSELSYIDDELPADRSVPVTPAELSEFVELLRTIGVERAESCAYVMPELSLLPTGSELARKFAELDALRQLLSTAEPEIADWSRIDAANPDVLHSLTEGAASGLAWSNRVATSWLVRVREQLADPLLRNEWEEFTLALKAEREQALSLRKTLVAHRVDVPSASDPAFVQALCDARDRLASKGKLGAFDKGAKRALADCSIDGRTPSTVDDVVLCLDALHLNALRRQLATRWENQVVRLGGPQLDPSVPEESLGAEVADLDRLLSWGTSWGQFLAGLKSLDIHAPDVVSPDAMTRLTYVLQITAERSKERQLAAELDALSASLAAGSASADASQYWTLLRDALEHRRTEEWDACRSAVADLVEHAPSALRLRDLRGSLSAAAPVWTNRVLTDPAAAGDPSRFSSAWEWRQLDTWLTSIRAAGDPAALQRKLETLGVLRRRTVAELVAQRAWRRLADNLGDRQRQALNSYMQAMKRYGKTGGKFAARWLAEIRQALDESKDAVPVWIMTTGRALTSFRPAATPPFDVLVIDEASQIGIDAIPLFSLARTAIVVGDDKQTSPENVGLDRQAVFDLLDEHLMAVPKYRTLFDADNSLYDLAFQKFPDVVMLTEHFRSLPPIIQFSNVHAYDGRIVPLRDQAPHLGWQAVGSIRVEDGYRKGDANEPEADVVVDLIEKLIADPNYDGMDFGVVSILGSTQSKLIWDRLYERIGPKVMRERNLRCGEAANFQGDERDVMVISTVVAVNPGNPSARIGAMTGRAAERRINVAASRARNQMWVVHSVEPDSFPNGDLRADLIRHCQSPQLLDADLENLLERCDSDFERHVVTRILARGYRRVRVQHPVGRFRIDIVVEGAQSRLAVECDGDRWHGEDAWHRDRMRQEVLERAGWTFERIRGSSFYRDPDNALEPLWQRLDELGIFTGDMQPEEIAPPIAATTVSTPRGEELVDRADDVVVAAGAPKSRAPEVDTEFAEEWTASRPERLEPEDDFRLDEYVEWKPNSVPAEPSTARPAEIVDSLADIVRQEGPIKALRAYQLYVKAAGGQRVGREIRRRLNQAASQAVRLGRISCIADDETEQIEKTYFSPDGPAIAVRELGSRRLDEVPESEIQSLIQKLGGARVPDIKRRVLDAYGLTRLTAGADAYLDACIRYEWKQPGS